MMKINRYPFTVQLPNQPYVEDFSLGLTHSAYYTGPRFLKFQIQNNTGELKELVVHSNDLEDLNRKIVHPDENHSVHFMDAQQYPWEAAFLTNWFELDSLPDYVEDLGTVDDEGNTETWTYSWGQVLRQIYYAEGLKFINGEYIKPRFRSHQHTNEKVFETLEDHIEMCDRELSRGTIIYKQSELDAIQNYKEQLVIIPEKYQGIDHWKIRFPDLPLIKP